MKVCGLNFVEHNIAFGAFDYVCEDPAVRLSQIGPGDWLAVRNWCSFGKGKTPKEALQDLILKMEEVVDELSSDISAISTAMVNDRPRTLTVCGFQFHWVTGEAEYQCAELPGAAIWKDDSMLEGRQWCCCVNEVAVEVHYEVSAEVALEKVMQRVLDAHERGAARASAWAARKIGGEP